MNEIRSMLGEIWVDNNEDLILSKVINVTSYKQLNESIPDDELLIEEVIQFDDLCDVWASYSVYIDKLEIMPFLISYGNVVICIGFGSHNKGKIFYFDFDFGCIPFDDDDLNMFLNNLE